MSSPIVYTTRRLLVPVKITFPKGTNPAVVRDMVNRMNYEVIGSYGLNVSFKPKVKMRDCAEAMMFSTQIRGPKK